MIEYTVKVYDNGNRYWYLNSQLHREDGPACEYTDGAREWWLNGELHREDGPAVECANGTRYWYLNGKYHREDGPAVEYPDGGSRFWYLNGEEYTKEEFLKLTTKAKELTVAEIESMLGYQIKVVK